MNIKNEYPTEEDLDRIRHWPGDDSKGLMNFVHEIWHYAEPNPGWCGWKKRGRKYWLHTGGWSGNEDIISAMNDNFIFWSMCWIYTRRGGHYLFETHTQKVKKTGKVKENA